MGKAGNHMDMHIDFHDKPVENEFDRMFDYDVDDKLNPVEQANRLDFITGYSDDDEDEYVDSCDDDMDLYDDNDYCGYYISETERQKQDDMLKELREAHKRREAKKALIICGILMVSSIVFASSPGVVLFIGLMLLSAKISKIF